MKNMHIMWGKQKEQMPHGVSKKRPAKTNSREKNKKSFLLLLLPNLFREGAHMGKNRLEKKIETGKNQKKTERAALHYTNASCMVAAGPAGPATAATATTATAATTIATLGGQVWMDHPLHVVALP